MVIVLPPVVLSACMMNIREVFKSYVEVVPGGIVCGISVLVLSYWYICLPDLNYSWGITID